MTGKEKKELAMSKPKMIGTINAYVLTPVTFRGKKLLFNGTTLDLVRTLVKAGGKPGDTFKDETGKTRALYSNPADDRVGGVWATTWNTKF